MPSIRPVAPEIRAQYEELITLVAKTAIEESPQEMLLFENTIEHLEKIGLLSDISNERKCCNPNAAKALWFDFVDGEGKKHCGWLFFDRALNFIEFDELAPWRHQQLA